MYIPHNLLFLGGCKVLVCQYYSIFTLQYGNTIISQYGIGVINPSCRLLICTEEIPTNCSC